MTPGQDSSNLLETLKQLYSRIVGLHAESSARLSLNQSKSASSKDIVSPLSECINKLAANAVNNPVDTADSSIPAPENHLHDHALSNREPSSRNELGELSLHLKNSHKFSGVSLNTGDKLMQSTWEHLHTSIRLARQGDVDTARLHADLTNNAFNEAVHYLSEPVYSRFSKDVIKALEDIKGQI